MYVRISACVSVNILFEHSFRASGRLQRWCRVAVPLTPFPCTGSVLCYKRIWWYICHRQENDTGTLLLTKLQTVSWCRFPLMFFICSRTPPRKPRYVTHHVPLIFSVFACFSRSWRFWWVLVRYFAECPSIWVCLVFFSWIDGVMGFKTTEVRWPCHYMESGERAINMTVHLDHLAKLVRARFLHWKVTIFPFHTLFLSSAHT